MKCEKCGAESEQIVKFCTKCGAPMGNQESVSENRDANNEASQTEAAGDTVQAGQTEDAGEEGGNPAGTSRVSLEKPAAAGSGSQEPESEGNQEGSPLPPAVSGPNKKFTRILTIVVALLAVISVGALACVKLTAKDPKEVVIGAFENIWPEDQTLPSEELFGLKAFTDAALTADSEMGFTLKMDSCSEPTANLYAGSGLRFDVKYDRTNNKSGANMGVIYNGMDLVNFNGYYGDETMMVSVPELSKRVFTIDLSEGLADRIAASPFFGPMMEEMGMDVEGFGTYFAELMEEAQQAQEEGKAPFDLKALMTRYKEGCAAQENFKEALTVEKAEKGTYTVDGKEVNCQGYDVIVSKDSMIEFLETSSRFFLEDQTLKEDFLRQMEYTVRMTELMGGSAYGGTMPSAQEIQEQSYEEVNQAVADMIDYLDGSLTDVEMTVYVDKKGNLAAVEGVTQMYPEELADEDPDYVNITFNWELQGGSYRTQNVTGNITLEHDGEEVSMDIVRQGTYDGKKLTDDISIDLDVVDETYNFVYTNTYNSDGGSYHTSIDLGGEGAQVLKVSLSGALDQLEKGKSFHMDIDALEVSAMDNSFNVVLSGEYFYQPLSGEVTPLEGEAMDILAATESDWSAVGMEIMYSAFSVLSELGVDVY